MCDPVVFAGRQTFSHLHFHFHSFPLLSPRHNAGSPCITQLLWLLAHTTSIRNPTSGRMACSLRPQHANMTVCQHFLQLNCYKVDGNQQKKEKKHSLSSVVVKTGATGAFAPVNFRQRVLSTHPEKYFP